MDLEQLLAVILGQLESRGRVAPLDHGARFGKKLYQHLFASAGVVGYLFWGCLRRVVHVPSLLHSSCQNSP